MDAKYYELLDLIKSHEYGHHLLPELGVSREPTMGCMSYAFQCTMTNTFFSGV